MRGDITKYLFIDSAVDSGRVSLPSQPFACIDNETMAFTLLNFTMRRNWPQINQTNNRFYIYLRDSQTFYETIVPPGDYADYASITTALNDAIVATIGSNASLSTEVQSITATHTASTRMFVFTIQMANGATANLSDVEIRCYHIKDGNVPTGMTREGAYSDSYEVLGANALKKDEDCYAGIDRRYDNAAEKGPRRFYGDQPVIGVYTIHWVSAGARRRE